MSGFSQLVLLVIILSLTFIVVITGVQVFQLLHDLRLAVRKINQFLDRPTSLASIIQAINSESLSHNPSPQQNTPLSPPTAAPSSPRRFFKKSSSH